MASTDSKAIQAKEKQEVAVPAEPTRQGPLFSPNVDIFETDRQITLLADLPGVSAESLTIDLRDDVLTLSGEVTPYDNADAGKLLTEYETGRYFRQFSLSEVVDQSRIEAKLAEGVLRLMLPKVEKAAPRTIKVTAV